MSVQVARELGSVGAFPLIIASHPRSGTHLVMDTLRRNFPACASWKWPLERVDRLYLNVESLMQRNGRVSLRTARRILNRTPRPLVKTHTLPGFVGWYRTDEHDPLDPAWIDWFHHNSKLCYVVRDGRSVMTSYHLFSQSFARDDTLTVGQFMRQRENGVNRVQGWVNHVRAWQADEAAEIVRFEDLIRHTQETLDRIARRFELTSRYVAPMLPRRFRDRREYRRARAFHVRPESTAILGRYVSRGTEKWQNAFSAADRLFFHDQAGDLLIELGYERDSCWLHTQGGKEDESCRT